MSNGLLRWAGVFLVSVSALVSDAARGASLNFVCAPDNDVFVAVDKSGRKAARFDSTREAARKAPENSALLILADGYPINTIEVDSATLEIAARKNLRLYVEFPRALPGLEIGAPRGTKWERGVVSADAFGPALPPMRLLAMHDCHFVPTSHKDPLLVVARVAGYDTAIFGLPKETFPILFEVPERRMLVATTKLSAFNTARYAPAEDWRRIWEFILRKLDPEGPSFRLMSEPMTRASYAATEKLPRNFERSTIDHAAGWLMNASMLVTPSRKPMIYSALATNGETAPLPASEKIRGDGSLGILEGYASGIQFDGTQLQRLPLRCDCQAESAMVLALASLPPEGGVPLSASLKRKSPGSAIASNLLDFLYFNSGMCQGVRADPKHPAFGLIGWGDVSPAWLAANYGDDNARTIMGTLLVVAGLKTDRWDEPVAKALLANFRTTGKLGFRGDRLDNGPLEKSGWKSYYEAAPVNYSPHFEAGLWACNLWAYRQTGFRPLFERTTNAIGIMMAGYPAKWRWQDNMERARMVLCLAWLVRLDDTPVYRGWLKRVAADLLQQQQPSGALYEQYHLTGSSHYRIPQSNEAYGTTETPLIQQNGNPVSDQLYGSGFVLFGLHEAVSATGDQELKGAEDKLAEFVCRCQIRSKKPWLDGWWFRAFDDHRWEAWASSADIGWGAWSLETGWGQAWSVATLALREKQTSFWEFTKSSEIAKPFAKWREQMLTE